MIINDLQATDRDQASGRGRVMMSDLVRFRRSFARRRADKRTDEQVRADTMKAMAQPIDVTLAKSRELLRRTQGKTSLMAQIAREYALARIWHIENGIPLPPFSNGNYDPDKFDVCSQEFPLIEHGLRQLRKAWKTHVC